MQTSIPTSKHTWLIGGLLLGFFLGLLLSGAMLLILDTKPKEVEISGRKGSVEINIAEDYFNQVINDNLPSLPGPFSLQTTHLNLRTNGRAAFAARLKLGPLEPVVEGTLGFYASKAGALGVQLREVKVGRLALGRLVPKGLVDKVNAMLEEEILARIGSTGLHIVGIESDADRLTIYLDKP